MMLSTSMFATCF